jgi:hypothetical protein
MFAMFGYFAFGILLNKTHTRINSSLIEMKYGPLQGAGGPDSIQRDQIAQCYYRYLVIPTRSGSMKFYAAGIETKDGMWLDDFG